MIKGFKLVRFQGYPNKGEYGYYNLEMVVSYEQPYE